MSIFSKAHKRRSGRRKADANGIMRSECEKGTIDADRNREEDRTDRLTDIASEDDAHRKSGDHGQIDPSAYWPSLFGKSFFTNFMNPKGSLSNPSSPCDSYKASWERPTGPLPAEPPNITLALSK